LLTAVFLVHEYPLLIIDQGPDPRTTPSLHCLGATHSGGNARMCTATEADCYAPRFEFSERNQFEKLSRKLGNGGWLSENIYQQALEHSWIAKTLAIPEWRGEGILRIYERADDLKQSIEMHRNLGVLSETLTIEGLLAHHPATRDGIATSAIAGGMLVDGFTLQIHDFCNNVITFLEQQGAPFRWKCAAKHFVRDARQRITHAQFDCGDGSTEDVSGTHYVVSTGSTTRWLYDVFPGAEAIRGMYGIWLDVPNFYGQKHSMKYRASAVGCEDANVTVVSDSTKDSWLLIGTGYCFIGTNSVDRNGEDFSVMRDQVTSWRRDCSPKRLLNGV
jgi:hypothetical protein